jgi:copper homeostasis protein
MTLEIACFNFESALIAQEAGADRIELCDNYFFGGITPSEETIKKVRERISIDLFVMIRPREGGFVYDGKEFLKMKEQIEFCKEQKCNGIVFGILTNQNKMDVPRCKELVELASPLHCTFHRAFDEVTDPKMALEQIIQCGFKRILTSGQKATAFEGAKLLAELQNLEKEKISIIAGGGVRSSNIAEIKRATGVTEFHSSAITGDEIIVDAVEIKKMKSYLMKNA